MRGRWLRVASLVWLSLWFGVIMPGHQRGAIAPPGEQPQVSKSHSCCSMTGRPTAEARQPNANEKDTPAKRAPGGAGHCAVCYLIATLNVPPAIDFGLERLGLLVITDWPLPQVFHQTLTTSTFNRRGPPMMFLA